MSKKNAEQKLARDVQAITGRHYTDCLTQVRRWRAEGKSPKDEIAQLTARVNEAEDRRSEKVTS